MKLTVVRLYCAIGGKPRSGYVLDCVDSEKGYAGGIFEVYVQPAQAMTMALEFLTGNIPWDNELPIKRWKPEGEGT